MEQQTIEGLATAGMECEACYLPFRVTERYLSVPSSEREVPCYCPECGTLVAKITTAHALDVLSIH
jgi:Zn finger protein HypA/HybF involved in hydrogenase expression